MPVAVTEALYNGYLVPEMSSQECGAEYHWKDLGHADSDAFGM